ncbi:hypothetical protein FGADI_8550 [Fusarium gaditjirri]|uniref:DUF7918 domain-containing protein n=1 Tax=Fusarium gaditjirri TaxID=282569 RepID=A0A8H4T2A2_9HYPO|nr:hypothetical protein FGADI_8550 [Fusarium gaditjirri]
MAVLPFIPGINISILVDGRQATEHIPQPLNFPTLIDTTGDEGIEHNQCYIQCHADSPFAIRFRISSDFKFPWGKTTLIIYVYVDGKPFDNRIIQKRDIVKATSGDAEHVGLISYCHRELSDGSSESYKPIFRYIRHPVYQSDDGSGISDPNCITALGSIQVAIAVARNAGPGTMGNDEFRDDKGNASLVIDNLALDRYGYGQHYGTTYTRTNESLSMDYLAVDREEHIGNFFFYYQSPPAENAQNNLKERFIDQNSDEMVHQLSKPSRPHKMSDVPQTTWVGK